MLSEDTWTNNSNIQVSKQATANKEMHVYQYFHIISILYLPWHSAKLLCEAMA